MNPIARLFQRARPPKAAAAVPHARGTVDVAATIDRALASAGLDRHAGPTQAIRATIDDALAQAGLAATGAVQRAEPAPDAARLQPIADPAPAGEFVSRSFNNDAGTRDYKLYLPHDEGRDTAMPLVVMLHGCTQSPDDFAAGTRMNQLADLHGFVVAYPAQAPRANGSKCWNWFRSDDQAHGRGEPSLIAGIAHQVALDHYIDLRRIFVAGLSAGGAMAVILGETYPDVFAAVGAHSGLPFAAAHDMSSAFTAMKGGVVRGGKPSARDGARRAAPTIVFHGDADHTVAASNALAIVHDAAGPSAPLRTRTQHDAGARAYTREVFATPAGQPHVEHWLVHGAGHAWSGGSAEGSYTDPSGPDASAEMIRFFLQQPPNPH